MSTTPTRRWSAKVTKHSNALDLDPAVFTWNDPRRIARSLKHSAEHSRRRKSEPYRSAMSMLTFYVNRAGDNLPASQRRVLERAKSELRHAFGRDEPAAAERSTKRSAKRSTKHSTKRSTKHSTKRATKRTARKQRASKSRA